MSTDRDASARLAADLQRELADEWLDRQQASGGVALSDAIVLETVRETATKLLQRLVRRASLREQQQRATAESPFDPEAARQRAEGTLLTRPVGILVRRVCDAAEDAAFARPSELPDLEVLVDTNAIKNLGGGPATVTQLHITLLEEGLEWVNETPRDGAEIWRLSQE
ncbi:hypothetical protein [Pendulispora albinea]|uniref:PIN domain-containing protein n=1 Tax=Pendulispora albinea TaxID=2741071 RepID=A0ABZ2MA48_9BACT